MSYSLVGLTICDKGIHVLHEILCTHKRWLWFLSFVLCFGSHFKGYDQPLVIVARLGVLLTPIYKPKNCVPPNSSDVRCIHNSRFHENVLPFFFFFLENQDCNFNQVKTSMHLQTTYTQYLEEVTPSVQYNPTLKL